MVLGENKKSRNEDGEDILMKMQLERTDIHEMHALINNMALTKIDQNGKDASSEFSGTRGIDRDMDGDGRGLLPYHDIPWIQIKMKKSKF